MYDKIPEKIRVGYKDYKVVVWTSANTVSNGRFGECDHACSEIRVMKDQCPNELANTLYHEILHACFWVYGLPNGLGDDRMNHLDEERAVTCISNAMLCVYRDNPALHDFLKGCLK